MKFPQPRYSGGGGDATVNPPIVKPQGSYTNQVAKDVYKLLRTDSKFKQSWKRLTSSTLKQLRGRQKKKPAPRKKKSQRKLWDKKTKALLGSDKKFLEKVKKDNKKKKDSNYNKNVYHV